VPPHFARVPVDIGHGAGIEIFVAKLIAHDDMERLSIDGFGKDTLHGTRILDDGEDLAHNVDVVELGETKEIRVAATIDYPFASGGKADGPSFFGKNAGRLLKKPIELHTVIPDPLFDTDLLGYGEVVLAHELRNIELECDGGRDPAGTSVGLFEVTQVFEPDHFVANGSRRDAEIVFFVERFGAYCLAGTGVLFDNGLDNADLTWTKWLHVAPPVQ
jgi:hypothetical protein